MSFFTRHSLKTPSGASISPCGKYRYLLWRAWSDDPIVTFIMLNPSTADASKDDPTIKKCIAFTKQWGMGGIAIVNLFAYRTPHPKELFLRLKDDLDPGDHNLMTLRLAAESPHLVCAWGRCGKLRSEGMGRMLLGWGRVDRGMCLGKNNDGTPKHLLSRGKGFIPLDTRLVPF